MDQERRREMESHLSQLEIQRRLIEHDEGSDYSGLPFRKAWQHRAYPNGGRLAPMDLLDRLLVEDLVEKLHRAETADSIKLAGIAYLVLLLAVWNAPWPVVWSLLADVTAFGVTVVLIRLDYRASHNRLGLDDQGHERAPRS